jgi:amidase
VIAVANGAAPFIEEGGHLRQRRFNPQDGKRQLRAEFHMHARDQLRGAHAVSTELEEIIGRKGLKGARLGVLHTLFGSGPDHQEVNSVMAGALEALKKQGAILLEVNDAAFDTGMLASELDVQKWEYKYELNNYLKAQPNPPVHSLAELIATGNYHKPSLEKQLVAWAAIKDGLNEADYKDRRVKIDDLRVQLANALAKDNLVALVYPHQKRLPVMIGNMSQAERNGILASLTGFPAITVPAGFSAATTTAPIGVPVGIEFLGQPFSEPELLKIAYSFEQATHARKPPQTPRAP